MPKQTFFNLPKEKRETIEQAALHEFSEYGFDNSNINRIVAQSGIAKGSFYQYFEDKQDVYFHLIDTLALRKIEALEPVMQTYQTNTFIGNIRAIFKAVLAFAEADPQLHLLGEDFANKQPAFTKAFFQKYTPTGVDVYTKLLEHAHQNDELYEDVDIPLVSSFINTLINQTSSTLMGKAPKKQRDTTLEELILFIERATVKPV